MRLYINGQLRPLVGEQLSVPAGRYSLRARLLPSGKMTTEQVIEVEAGETKRVQF